MVKSRAGSSLRTNGLLQAFQERLIKEAPLVEGAELLEHLPRRDKGQDIRRDVLAHGDVGRADRGLRDGQVRERHEL
jgi:hypothetical protein